MILLFLLPVPAHSLGNTAVAPNPAAMLTQINTFRGNNGLPAFQYNGALAAAAQNQANYMAANTIFSSHIGAGGSTPQSRATAAGFSGYVTENIVGGTNLSTAQGLNWWINSPVHYQALISTRHTVAGTGFATDGEQNFYVLVIGQPSNSPPPANSTPDDSPEPLIITPITLTEPAEDGSITHVVQTGQALWTLAAYYEVPLADLLLFNNLPENAVVQPGDAIIIQLAEGAAPPATPTPPAVHVVTEGQTLWTLAVIYNVKLGDLMLYNNLTESSLLQPGDKITVRLLPGQQPPPTPTPVSMHTIQSGETLWDVALRYGLDLDGLLALNPTYTADSILQPGEELWVRPSPPPPPPTQTPTVTPPPTHTPAPTTDITTEPTATPTALLLSAAGTATGTISPTAAATPVTPVMTAAKSLGRSTLLIVLGLGLGLTVLAGAGIIVARRAEN